MPPHSPRHNPRLLGLLMLCMLGYGCAHISHPTPNNSSSQVCRANNTVYADVVALEQAYTYNRFDAYNPAGMLFALRRDVVDSFTGKTLGGVTTESSDPAAGRVRLRSDKRPRPLVLRVNEGECLQVTFTNLLSPKAPTYAHIVKNPATGDPFRKGTGFETGPLSPEHPFTRHASMHVNGLYYAGSIASDGANVGMNPSSLIEPGKTTIYTWYAKAEGSYFMYSMGTVGGGEGDGGQLGLGLFGAVNVEPPGAKWYRSQVAAEDIKSLPTSLIDTPIIDYKKFNMRGGSNEILHSDLNAVIDISPKRYINEKPDPKSLGEDCGPDGKKMGPGSACGQPFREFTVIFHDEITADQAFPELTVEGSPLEVLKDNMAINYGAAGVGSVVLANRKGIGPSRKCKECKLEEFFLTSWVNGDPALVLAPVKDKKTGNPVRLMEKGEPVRDTDGNPQYQKQALYPDDPSNVHHSYVGDPVRFRNIHAGPKETHVFHLHAHQWVQDKHDPNSVYLDSQTISPGTSFNYEVHYGGSGNRNLGPGDSIFHCHLYPHFAQGMWELWRAHDVFEDGTPGLFDPNQPTSVTNSPRMRNLPDAEIAEGTPTPALVPLPHKALPPMPSKEFRGYPFYIAGEVGHRPPQPPNDFDKIGSMVLNGGLPRHIILAGETKDEFEAAKGFVDSNPTMGVRECRRSHESDLAEQSRKQSDCIAQRTHRLNSDPLLTSFARELTSANIKQLNPFMSDEKVARDFHAGEATVKGHPAEPASTGFGWEAKGYPSCDAEGTCDSKIDPTKQERMLSLVNGLGDKPGAPFGNPCPKEFDDDSRSRMYRGAYIQLDMTVNKQGWHDPQARIAVLEEDIRDTISRKRPAEPLFFRANSGDCVVFKSTNLVPSVLNLDDFQVFSPTDTIGQHIHLVKFDVTSSDGSGNGWNYEDGTFSPDEVRERLHAHNEHVKIHGGSPLTPKTHPMFLPKGAMAGDTRGYCSDMGGKDNDLIHHPWCGAQTTVQRWWADPLLNGEPGKKGTKDRTLRTVFTHDHFGPSSHQHHGLYAALVVEPAGTEWQKLDGSIMGGTSAGSPLKADGRHDGGPTSYAALIRHPSAPERDTREFNLAVADFAIVYNEDNWPVNPDHRHEEMNLPSPRVRQIKPNPQGISPSDPGTALFNYRNEPIPLRIGKKDSDGKYSQKDFSKCTPTQLNDKCAGDLAYAFSSAVHQNTSPDPEFRFSEESVGLGNPNAFMKLRDPGDPGTPLLFAYQGEQVNIRLIQGAQESQHVFNMHGVKWHAQPDSNNSGWTNAQQLGISEHFEFDMRLDDRETTDYLYSSPEVGNLWHGAWGILRGFNKARTFLPPLKSTSIPTSSSDSMPTTSARPSSAIPADPSNVCPQDKPTRAYEVGAWLAKDILPEEALSYNEQFGLSDQNAIIFVDMTSEVKRLGDVDDLDKKLTQPDLGLLKQLARLNAQEQDKAAGIVDRVSLDLRDAWPLQAMLRQSYWKGHRKPEPLILRAAADECIKIRLTNFLPIRIHDGPSFRESWSANEMPGVVQGFNFNQITMSNRVGLHAALVDINTRTGDGSAVGKNEDSTRGPGKDITYYWYAGGLDLDKFAQGQLTGQGIEFGVVPLQDMGDVIKHSSHGAIGALVIEPKGATWETDPSTSASATVRYKDATGTKQYFREFVLLYQDDVSLRLKGEPVVNRDGVDDVYDLGQKAFNYRTEPLWARLGLSPGVDLETFNEVDHSQVLSSKVPHAGCQLEPCDPATPLFIAKAGDPVRFRIVNPAGHSRQHGFTLHGHDWVMNPWECDTNQPGHTSCDSSVQGDNQYSINRVGSSGGLGPTRHLNILTTAGGPFHIPGDYLYRTQESFQFDSGLWGIFCVYDDQSPNRCRNRSSVSSR